MTVDDSLENQTTRLPQEAPRRLSNERLEVRLPMHALQDQEDTGEAGPDEMVPASTSHPFGAAAATRRSRTSGPIDQIGAVPQGWGNLPNPKKLLERTRSLVFGREDSDSEDELICELAKFSEQAGGESSQSSAYSFKSHFSTHDDLELEDDD